MELTNVQMIVGFIVTVLSALGMGTIILAVLNRRWKKKDEKEITLADAHSKEIDQDVNAFNSIYRRLEIVEKRLDEVQAQFTEQKVENAKLEAKNSELAKDNDRLEKEVERQRMRLHEFAGKLQEKDLQILELNESLKRNERESATLRSELHETTTEFNKLKQRISGEMKKVEA